MDKCEIIKRLKNIAGYAVHTVGEEPFVMSLDDGIAVHEAIELLEKPETDCSGIPNNSDTISRQQTIDALRTCYDTETITMDNGDEYINYEDAVGEIENLPLVQLESCGDAVSRNAIVQKLNTMDRYVSAELRLCDIGKEFPQNEVFIVDDVYEKIVEQLPSIQPECPKGRWIPTASGKGRHECSRCHEYAPCYQDGSEHLSTFCVLCGAKMEEGK